MIKGKQKFLPMLLSGILVFNFITTIQVKAIESNDDNKINVKNINPKVQKIDEIGEGFKITKTVNLIGQEKAHRESVEFLKEILINNNINISESFDRNNTTIVLGEVSGEELDEEVVDIVEKLGKSDDEAFQKNDGYILHTSNDYEGAENGLILIAGKEEDGTFYGVSSLKQIIHGGKDVKIPEVHVSDYSSINFRGVVEGFYGEQWSHEDRKNILELSGDYKMNSYIYGTKGDPYNNDKWREPYSENDAKKIQELVSVANKNNVDFVWAINLVGNINFTEEDYNDLLNKCNLMYDLGVRAFAIFLDDISEQGADANKQADFLNKLNNDLVKSKGDVGQLIMFPTENNKLSSNNNQETYLDILGDKLDQDIQIIWTGDKDMPDINKSSLEWINNRVKRDVYVWWNFPVNDYCRDRLLLGEAYGLGNDVDNVIGFVSNPMNQAQASKFALYSVANYSWNVKNYDPTESWNNAIETFVPEVADDFKTLSLNNADAYTDYHQYRRKESEHMKPFIDEFSNNIKNGEDITTSASKLIEEFEIIEKASKNIYENCEDKLLIEEIEPWALSFEQLGIAGQHVVNSILNINNGDFESWWENYSKTKHALDEMNRISGSNNFGERRGANVATKVLTPFVKEMFEESANLYKNIFQDENNSIYELNSTSVNSKNFQKNYTNIEELKELNLAVNSDGDIVFPKINEINIESGEYLGVELNSLLKINDVLLDFEATEDSPLTLEYSINGIEWNRIDKYPIDGKYIRVINNGEKRVSGTLNTLKVDAVMNINARANTNVQIHFGTTEELIDGNKESYLWIDEQKSGDYYEVDLGSLVELHDVTVYMDSGEGSISGTLEVSKDNITWTTINDYSSISQGNTFTSKIKKKINAILGHFENESDIREEKQGLKAITGDANGHKYRYIRLKMTEDSNTWSKICEIEFNKEVPDEIITSISGAPNGEFEKVADGGLDTAYIAGSNPKEGDYLMYKMTTVEPIESINILQNEGNISNGKVSVRTLEGEWIKVGVLDKAFNKIDLSSLKNKNILNIKIEWEENKVKPFIYEITPIYSKKE